MASAATLLGACDKHESPSPGPAATPAPSSPDLQAHLTWEDGPAAMVLARARTTRTPLLLYLSSTWCPPCRALEASLFSKQAFWTATRSVLHLRIDGDSDGAQALAERFEAWAYPTILLLSPDGEELFRAHHAVSLEELDKAVRAAASSGHVFSEALKRLETATSTAQDCTIFATTDWTPGSAVSLPSDKRLAALQKAFTACAAQDTRAAIAGNLLGIAAITEPSPARDSVRATGAALLDSIFASEPHAYAARVMLTTWAVPVVTFLMGNDRGPQFASLRDKWLRAATWIRTHPEAPLDMQLLGYNAVLDFHKLEHPGAPLPEALRGEIEASVSRVQAQATTPAERSSVIPNAAYLLRALGHPDKARAMLLAEIARTDTPSYYQTTLSQWALADGKKDEARQFARDARLSAKGRASRIQWAVDELLLYGPDSADRAYLLERATDLYALLFSETDAFLGRNRSRTDRLASLLAPVSTDPAIRALADRYSPRCSTLPEESRERCRKHFMTILLGAPK